MNELLAPGFSSLGDYPFFLLRTLREVIVAFVRLVYRSLGSYLGSASP